MATLPPGRASPLPACGDPEPRRRWRCIETGHGAATGFCMHAVHAMCLRQPGAEAHAPGHLPGKESHRPSMWLWGGNLRACRGTDTSPRGPRNRRSLAWNPRCLRERVRVGW